ncbi:hypothetical protein ANTPLA_LOCUS8019 [Anthophora plagiata]
MKTEYGKADQLTQYPQGHKGPAYVSISIKKEGAKARTSQNLLNVARMVNSAATEAEEIKPQGYGNFAIKFKSGAQANSFVSNENPTIKVLNAFIPKFRVQRRGIIKGVCVDHDLQNLINNTTSPCKILQAKRLNRRYRNNETNQIEWIPSETVLLTFEGTVLPDSIKLYHLIIKTVGVYVEQPRTCKNCYRYGHSAKHCRSPQICKHCGATDHTKEDCPSKEDVKCLLCKGDHRPFDSSCKQFQLQREIAQLMAHSNISFWEARDLASNSSPAFTTAPNPPPKTTEHFPPLKPTTPDSILSIKAYGGQQKPAPPFVWAKSHPVSPKPLNPLKNTRLQTHLPPKTALHSHRTRKQS